MSYTLVIVESPAKCKKIEEFLGSGYRCVASFGHIRELPHIKNIGNGFCPTYVPMKSKAEQVKKIKALAQAPTCKEVVLAVDDDREGDAIGWHLCQVLKLDCATVKRIVFHEISKTAVQHAIANPQTLNMASVKAQQCRQILDVLVGFTISPVLWSAFTKTISSKTGTKSGTKSKTNNGLSAGRCQTPALRLVYDNCVECKQSKGDMTFKTTGIFGSDALPFVLKPEMVSATSIMSFLESSINFSHVLSVKPCTVSTRKAPTPFTTASLLQTASNELRMGPKETMKCAQTLYENGHITYMRTDSEKYSAEFLATVIASTMVQSRYGRNLESQLVAKLSSAVASATAHNGRPELTSAHGGASTTAHGGATASAHEAIRPVNIDAEVVLNVNDRAQKLYELIWCHTLETCMASAQVHVLQAKVTSPVETHTYTYSCEQVVFYGWKCIVPNPNKDKDEKVYRHLHGIRSAVPVKYASIVASPHLIHTKSHLTEARLIQLLKDHGIGRPSTFAAIVDKIQEKEYVKKRDLVGKKQTVTEFVLKGDTNYINKNTVEKTFGQEKDKLVVQPLGTLVVEFCVENWPTLFDYEYTNSMEKELDKIATSCADNDDSLKQSLCNQCCQDMVHTVKPKFEVAVVDRERPELKLSLIIGKNGPVVVDKTDKTDKKKAVFISVRNDLDVSSLNIANTVYLEDVIKHDQKNDEKNGEKDSDKAIISDAGIIRQVSASTSVRTGKKGRADYVYYKTERMKKPKFISLSKFEHDHLVCDAKLLTAFVTLNKDKK